MDLSELRDQVINITGYPERGATGTTRINSAINYSLRQLWREMPESLLKEEFRFRTEPNISINTLTIDGTDSLSFSVDLVPTALGASSFATDGTLRARWLEVQRDGKFYYRRIRDVFQPTGGLVTAWKIIVDEPWDNNSDTGLTYKIVTKEYPYPTDLQTIRRVLYDPENEGQKVTYDLLPDEMSEWRLLQGYRRETKPTRSTRGDFYSMPSPHYAPEVSATPTDRPSEMWGFNTGGIEQEKYGPAGNFSYRVVHVWGRRPFVGSEHARPHSGTTHTLEPFYQSSPSKESSQVSTTWGGGMIKIVTPDIDYMNGYGREETRSSYHRYGVEKWIFRARHSVNTTGSNSLFPEVEADGVYYLWRITEGDVTTTYDRGNDDPVDKNVVLKDCHGHYHLRFDSYPTASADVVLSVIRRPDTLKYDTDISRVPPECYGALIDLTCSYLVGRRDGEPKRESYYYSRYMNEVDRLRVLYTFSGLTDPSFGEGLSTSAIRGGSRYTVQEG
tara:strand:- start:321 stop:1826 length:1506 start_codon:yes stop_codon:yes gene_type:complete